MPRGRDPGLTDVDEAVAGDLGQAGLDGERGEQGVVGAVPGRATGVERRALNPGVNRRAAACAAHPGPIGQKALDGELNPDGVEHQQHAPVLVHQGHRGHAGARHERGDLGQGQGRELGGVGGGLGGGAGVRRVVFGLIFASLDAGGEGEEAEDQGERSDHASQAIIPRMPPLPAPPPLLFPGARVGVFAPSGVFNPERLQAGWALAEAWGVELVPSPNLGQRHRFLAGDDEARLTDLRWALTDPSLDGAWMARGGYGLGRLLSRVDWSTIQSRPVIGFSDGTALHLSLIHI